MIVHTLEPFDFRQTLRFILSPPVQAHDRRFPPLLDYFVEGEYRRVAALDGELVLYGVSETGSRSSGALKARILAGGCDQETGQRIASLVRRQFATDLDLKPFHQLTRQDPVLASLVRRFRGMRIPQATNVYETLISAILEQQVNLAFAHKVKRALVETYGRSFEFERQSYRCFPLPAALAAATVADFRRLEISGPKARYIIRISSAILDGSLDLEALRPLEFSAAREKLLALKGVGAWTAHYVSMRALAQLDCLPAADVGLQKVIQWCYGLAKQPSVTRVERIARAWSGWRSYATFYLWLTYWEDAQWREELLREIRSRKKQRT